MRTSVNHQSRFMDASHDQISPTAWPVAYDRTFSDIPFSQELFDALLEVRGQERSQLFDETQIRVALAPQFEARHKLLDRLIKESGIRQILELASGLTSRGLIFTEDSSVRFVETDLPLMIEEKRKIIELLTKRGVIPLRTNLFLESANALSFVELKNATRHFSDGPIAIVNEGLLRYLNFEEKAEVAQNVHTLLVSHGGVWITPDISTVRIIDKEKDKAQSRVEKISKLTGRDISKNLFEGPDEAQTFFEHLGFSVERHRFMEVVDELVSPKRLNLTDEYVQEIIGTAVFFVMRVRP